MQSQIREVMHQSTTSLSIPPGHGEPEYLGNQGSSASHYSQQYSYGGHNGSMVNDAEFKTPRSSHIKNFSSRLSTSSYQGASSKEMTEAQRVKREHNAHQVSQRGWLDRQRQHKNFALYTFVLLNAAMIFVIVMAAIVWVALHLIKSHRTVGIPVNSGLTGVVSD